MPEQEEHDKPENLVEQPHQAEHEARTLEDAVDSNATLEGYFAMNDIKPDKEEQEELEREERSRVNTAHEK